MKALLVCSTYGRIPYLSTMLSGFLHQSYDDKHLVIVNDDKNVDLCCNYDNVTVINCNQRMLLSEKRNLGIASGYHDIIFPYDDDDIFLPNRLHNHIKKYEDESINAYNNTACYVTYGGKFVVGGGPPNDVSFRKSEWFRVGGYVNKKITGEDVELFDKLSNKLIENDQNNKDFVYCFSGINYHLSCESSNTMMDERAYNQLKEMNLLGKKYWIEPNFDEYSKYLYLEKIHMSRNCDLDIFHLEPGKIDISHLL